MTVFRRRFWPGAACLPALLLAGGCTARVVGDPDRPITIKAHVTLDVKGLQQTADSIEDYVSGERPEGDLPVRDQGGR